MERATYPFVDATHADERAARADAFHGPTLESSRARRLETIKKRIRTSYNGAMYRSVVTDRSEARLS